LIMTLRNVCTKSTPFAPSKGMSLSRGSKRKALMVNVMDAQFPILTTKLDDVSHAMQQGNSVIH